MTIMTTYYANVYIGSLTENTRSLLVGAAGRGVVDDHADAAVFPLARGFTALISTASVLLAVERAAYVALVVFGLNTFEAGEAVVVAVVCVVPG